MILTLPLICFRGNPNRPMRIQETPSPRAQQIEILSPNTTTSHLSFSLLISLSPTHTITLTSDYPFFHVALALTTNHKNQLFNSRALLSSLLSTQTQLKATLFHPHKEEEEEEYALELSSKHNFYRVKEKTRVCKTANSFLFLVQSSFFFINGFSCIFSIYLTQL